LAFSKSSTHCFLERKFFTMISASLALFQKSGE